MPFNSSTPKIDGYCNSSVLATAKEGRRKEKKKKEPQQASVKWETLGSGWDQACKSTLTTGNRWTQHVSQSHGSTVHTSYSQHRHRERRRKRKSHFKHSPASEERERTRPPPPYKKKKTTKVTLYLQDDYLHYSQMIQKKSLCAFPLLLHSMLSVKQRKKRWVHSFDPQKQVFLRPSWMAVGGPNR